MVLIRLEEQVSHTGNHMHHTRTPIEKSDIQRHGNRYGNLKM
jgi:hypothetical protein